MIRPALGASTIYVSTTNSLDIYNAVDGSLQKYVEGRFQSLATNTSGNVYVGGVRSQLHALQTFTSKGKRISPTVKSADPSLGIAVGGSGKIYVQTTNNTIDTYTARDVQTTPTISGAIASFSIAADANEKVYVAQYLDAGLTIKTFTSDGSPTTPTIVVGGGGCQADGFDDVLAVDGNGKIYVAAQQRRQRSMDPMVPAELLLTV